MGCLQRLPHGHHGRERRAPMADHPRRSRTSSRSLRRTRPRRRGRRAVSRKRSFRSPSRAARAKSWSPLTSISATTRCSRSRQASPGLRSERGNRHRGQCKRHQRRRGGARRHEASEAEKRGIEPLARIVSYATAGVDPSIMGTGPIPASKRALERAGWSKDDLDLIEANEAFAAQACAVNKAIGWDTRKVNVNGGAIAIGHPIGASGARVLTTLLYEMKRRDAKRGLATFASAAAWASPCAWSASSRSGIAKPKMQCAPGCRPRTGGVLSASHDKRGMTMSLGLNLFPAVTFQIMKDGQPASSRARSCFRRRSVALFGMPGAFTPACHHIHLPRHHCRI